MSAYVIVLMLCLLGAFTEPAQAYIDPGTGSLFVQALFGTLAMVLVVMRTRWAKFKAFVKTVFVRLRGQR